MVRILAVSDSHGRKDILNELAERYANKVDYFVHCGDSELESSDLIWEIMTTVRGNCDYDYDLKDSFVLAIGDRKILTLHGHHHAVKTSNEKMKQEAKQNGASVVFYGHSHVPVAEQEDGIVFINPGSISQPRGPIREKTYCIVEIENNRLTVSYYTDQHKALAALNQSFFI